MAGDRKDFCLTWEQAVELYRSQPVNQAAVAVNYFDRDVVVAAKRFAESPEFKETLALLPARHRGEGVKVLEVGAGAGIASYAFAARGFDVTALEPDPSAIVGADAIRALAERTDTRIRVVQEWGEGIPFSDEAFDVVYARQVLHHARDLRQLCAEVARVLRTGGLFVAVREHVIRSTEDLPAFLASHPLHSLYGGEHAYLLTEYETAIRDAGLVLTQLLGPFDCVINYYPATPEQVAEAGFRALLAKWGIRRGTGLLWRCGGRRLTELLPSFAERCGLSLRACYSPGNIFSFVTEKRG